MSDLSNLLGDVYGDHSTSLDGPPVRREPAADQRAPEWAGDNQLDRAFENWVPGEPPTARQDLTSALHAALAAPAPAPALTAPVPAPALEAPMPRYAEAPAAPKGAWTTGAVATAPAPVAVAAPAAASWSFGDDDIFPMGRGGKKAKKK